MKRMLLTSLAVGLLVLACAPLEQTGGRERGELKGVFQDWSALTGKRSGKQICWASTTPLSWPQGLGWLEPFLMFEVVNDQLSIVFRGGEAPGGRGYLTVGDSEFPMVFLNNAGWLRDDAADKALVAAVGGVLAMTITSAGKEFKFSTRGFRTAVLKAKQVCGQI